MKIDLVERVAEFLVRHGLARKSGVIALSGGPDSVALASTATALLRRGLIAGITLAHVNHQLRGADSDTDEAFVLELGQEWAIPTRTTRIDVRAMTGGENLEAAARRLRYGWLAQVAAEVDAAWVATGHNADDQAETVLFRLLRGSGIQGLTGIPRLRALAPESAILLVRPLLDVSRKEIIRFLEEQKIAYRVDRTNEDRSLARNRLRHEVLPLLREQNPAIADILGRLAEQAAQMQEAIGEQAEAMLRQVELPRAGGILVLSAAGLAELKPFWRRELFRLIWQREGWPMGEMNFEDWQRLAVLAVEGPEAIDFPGGVRARRLGRVVQLVRQ